MKGEKAALAAPQLVFTGDVLERDGQRYDVIIADMNIFVTARRKVYRGKETGVTSYRGLEVYANSPELGDLEKNGFTVCGRWLKDSTPLGEVVKQQREAVSVEEDEACLEEPEA